MPNPPIMRTPCGGLLLMLSLASCFGVNQEHLESKFALQPTLVSLK
jgi:hypothetical protein